jgi:hypothetical protein
MNSLVREAIARVVGHDNTLDLRFGVSTNRVGHDEDECRLTTGEESYFTSMLGHYIGITTGILGSPDAFSGYFYTPSRTTEPQLGCDLSLGQFDCLFRIRLMHMMKYGTWCDTSWKETFGKQANAVTASADRNNLRTLLATHSKHPNIAGYLVVNTAVCVHEYRRMGFDMRPIFGFSLPALNSLLRTVVVDLHGIIVNRDWDEMWQTGDDFGLLVEKRSKEFVPEDFGKANPFSEIEGTRTVSVRLVKGQKSVSC